MINQGSPSWSDKYRCAEWPWLNGIVDAMALGNHDFDYGVNVFNDHPTPLPPDTNVPPSKDNGTHSGINRKAAALRFVEAFLYQDPTDPTGQVVPECLVTGQAAPCDCATGACD